MLLVQGDVFLTKAQNVPERSHRVKRSNIGYVLATEQSTGHVYVIEEEVELYENHGTLYVKTDRRVYLKHDEHKAVQIDEGVWEVCRVRDYELLSERVCFILN
ncbi:MAG: hypothetical protein HQL06_10385 [Nitrospirae bacterium]|nr:hypothetical protein [Nitrospirota bacterium]